jgi:hypothetical protein
LPSNLPTPNQVVWEIYTGKLPWQGMQAPHIIVTVVSQQRRLDVPPTLPPAIKALLAACWTHEPTKRRNPKP